MTKCFSAGDVVNGFMKDASKSFNTLCFTATGFISSFAPFAIMDWSSSGEISGSLICICSPPGLQLRNNLVLFFLHRRLDLNWCTIVHLVLFNLSQSRMRKYYDLDSEIMPFLNEHWDCLQLHQLSDTQPRERCVHGSLL